MPTHLTVSDLMPFRHSDDYPISWQTCEEAVARPGAIGSGIRERMAMIQPGATFRDNLQQLPPAEGVQRIDLVNANGAVVASIENQPGKQGSLAVYQYLKRVFGTLDAMAAEHGLLIFAEHTVDALNRPGAHPNVDRLLAIAAGDNPLDIEIIAQIP